MRVTMSWSSVLKRLLAVCIFAHLSVICVESYSCENKDCFNGRCLSNPRTCESSKGCFYRVQNFEAPYEPATDLRLQERGCSKDKCTELAFSATLGGYRTFTYDHKCCYTDQCNKEPRSVSRPSLLPNGVECPACFSDNGTCNPVSLKCTGVETQCMEVTAREVIESLPPRVIHGMGCATKSACNLKNLTIGENMKINTVCSKGSPPLRSISSVLAGLFLVKALL
ncbi:protein RoBo-1-like [Arvicola amphibius]|uniref:protein RoBo-1-like n=1 Tax=Arvicola amphibius TaxID=1047088 RepID=UPI0018E319F7|nr:protein RoBo-1-like [Arvicola amphibius]XP_038184285.1 protein RoBo-1-like [Arvicola amphibius]XP_038184286.1 protein RoBo-1-like [Arvicola amphibius]